MGMRVQSKVELPGKPGVTELPSFGGTSMDCLRGDGKPESPRSGLDCICTWEASVTETFRGSAK